MFVMTAIAESREARLMSLASPASFRRQAFFPGALKTKRIMLCANKQLTLAQLDPGPGEKAENNFGGKYNSQDTR